MPRKNDITEQVLLKAFAEAQALASGFGTPGLQQSREAQLADLLKTLQAKGINPYGNVGGSVEDLEEILQGLSAGESIPSARKIPKNPTPGARAPRITTSFSPVAKPIPKPGVAGGGIPTPKVNLPKGGKGILGSLGKALGSLATGVGAFASANPLMLLLTLAGAPFLLEGWVDLVSKMRGTDPESRAMEAASKDRKLQLLANAIGISSENQRAEKDRTERVFDKTLGAISQEAMLDRMGPMGQYTVNPAAHAANQDRVRASQLAASFNTLGGAGPDASSIDPFIREGIF